LPLKIFQNKYIFQVTRIILGVVFVYASFDKISSPPAFAKIIFYYRMLPSGFENLIAIFFPWIELVTGLLLIVGKFDKAALFVYSVMMVIFIIALSQAQIRGLDIACGCFSVDPSSKSEVWLRIVLDLITLFFSINLYITISDKNNSDLAIQK
jgi:uncharacterized membrane protein YphA (DoxX/SURF4 family)